MYLEAINSEISETSNCSGFGWDRDKLLSKWYSSVAWVWCDNNIDNTLAVLAWVKDSSVSLALPARSYTWSCEWAVLAVLNWPEGYSTESWPQNTVPDIETEGTWLGGQQMSERGNSLAKTELGLENEQHFPWRAHSSFPHSAATLCFRISVSGAGWRCSK